MLTLYLSSSKAFLPAPPPKNFKGYRLFAADGSSLQIPYNPDHLDSLITYSNGQRPVNLLHLNALYDLCSNTCSDALIEGQNSYNEQQALITMCKRNPNRRSIYIADRGYESFNLLAHIQAAKSKFLIRIRDSCGIAKGLQLPDTDELDCSFTLKIFARLIMYNFCELITSHTITHQKCRNYTYKANFSTAVHICRQFLRGNISPPVVETQLLRYVLPIRPDRSFPRTPPARGLVSFNYRIA